MAEYYVSISDALTVSDVVPGSRWGVVVRAQRFLRPRLLRVYPMSLRPLLRVSDVPLWMGTVPPPVYASAGSFFTFYFWGEFITSGVTDDDLRPAVS